MVGMNTRIVEQRDLMRAEKMGVHHVDIRTVSALMVVTLSYAEPLPINAGGNVESVKNHNGGYLPQVDLKVYFNAAFTTISHSWLQTVKEP